VGDEWITEKENPCLHIDSCVDVKEELQDKKGRKVIISIHKF